MNAPCTWWAYQPNICWQTLFCCVRFNILCVFSACIEILCDVGFALIMNENKKKEKGDEKGSTAWNTVEKNSIIPIKRSYEFRNVSVFGIHIIWLKIHIESWGSFVLWVR